MNRLSLAAVLLLLTASGCASTELRGLRNDLGRTTPGLHIGEGRSFSFGAVSLGVARLALSIAGDGEDTDMARAALRGARRVQFAQYDVSGDFDSRDVQMPARIRRFVDDGWIPVVTLRDDDEVTWIIAPDSDEAVDEFLLVTLSADELTMAKVRGDLTELARLAFAEAGGSRADDEGWAEAQ